MHQVFPQALLHTTPSLLQHFWKLQIRRESPNLAVSCGAPVKAYTGACYIKVNQTHMGALTRISFWAVKPFTTSNLSNAVNVTYMSAQCTNRVLYSRNILKKPVAQMRQNGQREISSIWIHVNTTWCITHVAIKPNTYFPWNSIKYKHAIKSPPTAWDTKARMIQNKHQPKAPLPPTSALRSWGVWPNATLQLLSC